MTTLTESAPAVKTFPPVTGSYRWLIRPDADGEGRLRINGVEYRYLRGAACPPDPVGAHFLSYTGADGVFHVYTVVPQARACDCKDHKERVRQDGHCKHLACLRRALAALNGCTHCIHGTKKKPCFFQECIEF